MDALERRRMDVIAMSTIVIALGTFTSMVVEMRAAFRPILPAWLVHLIIALAALTALYYAISAVVKYHQH